MQQFARRQPLSSTSFAFVEATWMTPCMNPHSAVAATMRTAKVGADGAVLHAGVQHAAR